MTILLIGLCSILLFQARRLTKISKIIKQHKSRIAERENIHKLQDRAIRDIYKRTLRTLKHVQNPKLDYLFDELNKPNHD